MALPKLLIDGRTKTGTVPPLGGNPSFRFTYRTARPRRVNLYLDGVKNGGDAKSNAEVELLKDQVLTLEIDDGTGTGKSPVVCDSILEQIPTPCRDFMIDVVTAYKAGTEAEELKN